MKKKIAILQSNYIPWKGYFDIIHQVDEFIIYDDVQYTKGDWRNRNLIKTQHGAKWLTIPVARGALGRRINEVTVSQPGWSRKHWQSIQQSYARAPYFKEYRELFESLYLDNKEVLLSRINFNFIRAINAILGIDSRLSWSMDYGGLDKDPTQRLVYLCQAVGADYYLSGPAARSYLEEECFAQAGIELAFIDYSHYPEYPQLYPPFSHKVSVLDLIFMCGPRAGAYIWSEDREEG